MMPTPQALAGIAAGGLGLLLWTAGATASAVPPAATGTQAAEAPLYRCATETTVDMAVLGFELCDAEPTPALAARAEPDNLQTRDGALVVDVADGGIAAVAGVQPGDMIYRAAGVDVSGAAAAAAGLTDIATDSDTQINFLRRGRPYRIKLRR